MDSAAIIGFNAAMTSGIRPYYASEGASAAHYDLVTAADRSLDGDIDLYAGLAPPGGSILELGAGTGRIAIPLAERGFAVVGVDIAPTMLVQAEARRADLAADASARLRFVRADMRSLMLGQMFDLVMASLFTLAHVQPSVAWKQCFTAVARHLRPGGRFAAHLPLPEQMAQTPPPAGAWLFQSPLDEGGTLSLQFVDQAMNTKTGRFDLTLDYVRLSPAGIEQSRSRERYTLFHGDPLPFAERAGLRAMGEPVALGDMGLVHIFEKPAA